MRNVNRVIIAGNLTRDPESRQLPSNTPVVNFGLAANRRWKDRHGETQEETTFVECEAFGRQAEVLQQYARKGRGVFVEGRLRLDQWQSRTGESRSKLKIVVDNFQFTDSRGQVSGEGEDEPRHEQPGAGDHATASKQRTRSRTTNVDDLLPF